jgi:heme exporter protein A
VTLLAAEGLAVARGGLAVLEGLGFTLAPGQALILRGPNGSGKTTLLRTLAGLQPPEAGTIRAAPDAVAYAAHADGLKGTLTAAGNLAFWARIFGAPPGAIPRALDAFALTPLADRQAQHLSAGQKRRLGLARLLVTGRPVWALDEPTVSLDTAATDAFAAVIRAHCTGGGAAIIATHVDLRLPEARTLDVTAFRARKAAPTFGGTDAGAFA